MGMLNVGRAVVACGVMLLALSRPAMAQLGENEEPPEDDLESPVGVEFFVLTEGARAYVNTIELRRKATPKELSGSDWAALTMALLQLQAELGEVDSLADTHRLAANPNGYDTVDLHLLIGILLDGGHADTIEALRGTVIPTRMDVEAIAQARRMAAIKAATFADIAAAQAQITTMPEAEQPAAYAAVARAFLMADQSDDAVAAMNAIADESVRATKITGLGMELLRTPFGKFDFDGTQARPETYPAFERYAKVFTLDARVWENAANLMEAQGYPQVMQVCLLNALDDYAKQNPKSPDLGLRIVFRLPLDHPVRNSFLEQILAYYQQSSPTLIAVQVDLLCALGRADEARALVEAQEKGWDYLRDIVSPIRQLCYAGQIDTARAWAELQTNPIRKTDALIAIAAYEREHGIESDTYQTARTYALAVDAEFVAMKAGRGGVKRKWGMSYRGHEIPWHIVVDHALRQRDRATGRVAALDVIAAATLDAETHVNTRYVLEGIATAAATAGESDSAIRALTLATPPENAAAPADAVEREAARNRDRWAVVTVAAYEAEKEETVAALIAAAPSPLLQTSIRAAVAIRQAQTGAISAATAALPTLSQVEGNETAVADLLAVIASRQAWPIGGDPAEMLDTLVIFSWNRAEIGGERRDPLLANIGYQAAADPASCAALRDMIQDTDLPIRPRLWLAIGLARRLADLPPLDTAPRK